MVVNRGHSKGSQCLGVGGSANAVTPIVFLLLLEKNYKGGREGSKMYNLTLHTL